jgi:hypothetical protein
MHSAYPFYFYLMPKLLFISFLLFSYKLFSCAETDLKVSEVTFSSGSQLISLSKNEFTKPSPVWVKFFKRKINRKKAIAAILAFPIPGGILGLHRIYLGTEPYVPLIYIFTLGGGLILPIADFCVLISNKDISRFEKHKGIFMWIDNEKK